MIAIGKQAVEHDCQVGISDAPVTEQVIGASSVDVQRLEWREHGGWALTITASSFAELEQLRERGEQSALPINVGNARQHGNRVQALLTLEDIL